MPYGAFSHLLWFGVPALQHERLQAVELHLLRAAQHGPDALGELFGDLQLMVPEYRPETRQQLVQNHAVGEHIPLKEDVCE